MVDRSIFYLQQQQRCQALLATFPL